MSLNEFLHKIEKKERLGNTIKINNYGLENSFFIIPFINDDVDFSHILKIDPESQPDINNESEYCSRVNDEQNSVCLPIVSNFTELSDEKSIHYSLKETLYIKRNQKDIIDILNRTLQEIINLKTALETCNNVFSTDVSGTTPMVTISSSLTPLLQDITQNLDNIQDDFEEFYK